ncbi:MAG: hypothetical protein IPL53_06060 [Ignavibacteria bacterium]|nr:hypothetical protein [Ignavibacteria bacterium]
MKKNNLHFALSGNAVFKHAFAIFILICTLVTTASSQPLQLGQSVVTSWTFENDPNYKVVRVIDIRNKPPFIAPGTYWNAPPQYSGANWTKQRMRNVFGITLDDQNPPNIFISSSSINCVPPDQNDSGLIYRIDGNTWQVTNYTTSTFAPGPPQAGTGIYTMPNTGPRMGNLCYDVHHDQIFATNLEDGVIYRIKDNGLNQGRVEEFFDPSTFPFTPDNRAPGYPPHGDRLWGIGAYGTNTNDVKIYFCRWTVDSYTAGVNEIWSIALNPNGSMNTASLTLEITLPLLPGSPGSNPVSDIEFSIDGDMLLAERSMFGDCSNAHSSRILEYARNITGTYTAYVVHPVGMLINNGSNANSTGGADFGYGDSDSLTGENSNCDSIIAGTGDYLFLPANGLVYGVQLSNRNPSWINNAQNYSDFIDINNNIISGGDKTTPGDIDVYTDNSCANTCISILKDTVYCDSTGTYIYQFQVKNNSPTQFLEQLELTVDSPQPPNYVVAMPSNIVINPRFRRTQHPVFTE